MLINSIAMASSAMSSVEGLTTGGGVALMWNAICNYIDANATVTYSWTAATTSVPPVTDPLVSCEAGISTILGRVLNLTGLDRATTAADALGILSLAMNTAILSWQAILPLELGFTTTPGAIISPPTIALVPSGVVDRNASFISMCTNILTGLSTVMFSPVTGTHLAFVGGGFQPVPGIH